MTLAPSAAPPTAHLVPRARQAQRVLIIGAAAVAIGPLSIDMVLPAMPAIQQALGADARQVQATMGFYLVGLALGQMLYGPLSDAYGRKPPLLAGLGLYVAATVGCALAPRVEWLIALRLAQALGASAASVTVRAMLRDSHPPHQLAGALSLLTGIMGVAPIVAPLAGSLLFVHAGWRSVFGFLAIFGTGSLLAIATGINETHHAPAGRLRWAAVARDARRLLRHRQFRAHAFAGAATQSGLFAYVATAPLVFAAGYGASAAQIGGLFASSAVCYIAGSQLNRRLLARHPPSALLRYGLRLHGAAAVMLVLLGITHWGGLPLAMIGIGLGLGALGITSPNAVALALAPSRRRAGTAASLMGALQFSVAALASFAIGAASSTSLLPLGCTWALAALLAWLALRALPRR